MARKKTRRKTKKSRKKSTRPKKKLVGYTKKKGKYALVFKKGRKMSIGTGRYSKKDSLVKAAKRYLKR